MGGLVAGSVGVIVGVSVTGGWVGSVVGLGDTTIEAASSVDAMSVIKDISRGNLPLDWYSLADSDDV